MYFWSWNNEWIKKALSVSKRAEQPNMDGNVLARRIVSQSVRGLLTVKEKRLLFFPQHVYWLNSICCAICADRDGCSRVCVFPAGLGSNFRIMVGSASGPGSTFKAFLGSARVRVPLSNKIRVRVGSVRHIYGSLRVWVHIFGPVKTSSSSAQFYCLKGEAQTGRVQGERGLWWCYLPVSSLWSSTNPEGWAGAHQWSFLLS